MASSQTSGFQPADQEGPVMSFSTFFLLSIPRAQVQL